jgi:hypothetical protein
MVMEVSFVRHRERRDRVYVTRHDGSETAWDFPSYGEGLPHDLCHLVVEEELGMADGFWGFVDRGVDVELIDNQATLVRDGTPLVQEPGVDFTGLMAAEEAVAMLSPTGLRARQVGALAVMHLDASSSDVPDIATLGSELGFALPPGTSDEAIASVRRRLVDLAEQWRGLGDGEAITLTWPPGAVGDAGGGR